MQHTVFRGSTSSVMVWYGMLLGAFGLATLAYGVVMAAVRSAPLERLWALLGLVLLLLGAVVVVLGLRRRVVVTAEGVSWTMSLGGARSVPWEAIERVIVPQRGEAPGAVALRLRDGSLVPIAALPWRASSNESTGPHPW